MVRKYRKWLLITLIVVLLAAVVQLSGMAVSSAQTSGFVTVSGNKFYLDGNEFYFMGTNNYYMHYKSQRMVDDVFNDMQAMGLTVLRMWGFMDGPGQEGVTMQSAPGIYEESGFKKMDYAIYKAGQMGIKLVIPFVNYWDDFGGMKQYAQWFGESSKEAFYTNPQIKQAYKNYVQYVLNRVNTYTGVAYKNDPAIMAWELANEPRAQSDPSGNTLVQWADEMSTFIKSIDSNHLVAVGDEGFYGIAGHHSYPYSNYEGVDWKRLTALPNIDYGTFHLYPDHWNQSAAWGTQWIIDHVEDSVVLNKPVVLEEFGYQNLGMRDQVYADWMDALIDKGGAGAQFWILTGEQDDGSLYPDYDGFRVVYPSTTASLFAHYAEIMADRSSNPSPDPDPDPDPDPNPDPNPDPDPDPDPNPAPQSVKVEYRAADTNVSDNQMKPQFRIVNAGESAIQLSDYTIRYYFTNDSGKTLQYFCDWAQLNCSNIQASFVVMDTPADNADTYLEISFTTGAGMLSPGNHTGEMQIRLHYTDWSLFNEANDYSFDASFTNYGLNDRIILYHQGQLVYGIEP